MRSAASCATAIGRSGHAASARSPCSASYLDAIYLPVRPAGPKEGVLVAWGFTLDGERVLLDVCLGQRERVEDWLDLGRAVIRRGLRSSLLVVSDGARV